MRNSERTIITAFVVAGLLFAVAPAAHSATRYVKDNGADSANCGIDLASACRSISQAIALAADGDTVLVAPGRYGDLNRNGVLGDTPGEEVSQQLCLCVLAVTKNVIVISSGGAAVTVIDGRSVDAVWNVLLSASGGEFGRPGKGFMVTETARKNASGQPESEGIVLDTADGVMVRGNLVTSFRGGEESLNVVRGTGIRHGNDAAVRIEGNDVRGWRTGILGRGAATVSKNQVRRNHTGITSSGGSVVGNLATENVVGIGLSGTANATGNAAYMNYFSGFSVAAGFAGVLTKNNMLANSSAGQTDPHCGLHNVAVAGLVATNNYWGAASGPGTAPANRPCGAAATTTSPFATKPFSVKPLKP